MTEPEILDQRVKDIETIIGVDRVSDRMDIGLLRDIRKMQGTLNDMSEAMVAMNSALSRMSERESQIIDELKNLKESVNSMNTRVCDNERAFGRDLKDVKNALDEKYDHNWLKRMGKTTLKVAKIGGIIIGAGIAMNLSSDIVSDGLHWVANLLKVFF